MWRQKASLPTEIIVTNAAEAQSRIAIRQMWLGDSNLRKFLHLPEDTLIRTYLFTKSSVPKAEPM